MAQLSNRLAGLSPERQKLLDRLKTQTEAKHAAVADVVRTEPAGDAPLLDFGEGASAKDPKTLYRTFYDSVNRQLDTGAAGKFSFFLNFGYASNGTGDEAIVQLPPHYLNRNCTKLVLELIADTDLAGRAVLDVGCGRGGTVHVLDSYYKPAAIVGLDLSSEAVRFCRRTHRYPIVDFVQSDAERLPFRDGAFDVVTNVESSHSYPNIRAFYAETARVLKLGGFFLYTDVLEIGRVDQAMRLLRSLGFQVARERDITPHVLRSCQEIGRVHQQTFDNRNDPGTIGEFLGLPGSNIYTAMETGAYRYGLWRLKKESSGRASEALLP